MFSIQTSKHPRRYFDRLHEVSREWQRGHVRIGARRLPVCRRRGDLLWWPQLAITRTALGTVASKTAALLLTVGLNVFAGDQLFATYAGDAAPGAVIIYRPTSSSGSEVFTEDSRATNAGNVVTVIQRLSNPTPAIDSTAEVFLNAAAVHAMCVFKISGLDAAPTDASSVGTGSDASPTSGATGTLAQADEICIGAVGTEGPDGDVAGTWSNSFTGGQRLGTTGGGAASNVTISEGYKIVSATAAQTAAKTGITSRDWAAAIATYKAAAGASLARGLLISQAIQRAARH